MFTRGTTQLIADGTAHAANVNSTSIKLTHARSARFYFLAGAGVAANNITAKVQVSHNDIDFVDVAGGSVTLDTDGVLFRVVIPEEKTGTFMRVRLERAAGSPIAGAHAELVDEA